MRLFCLPYAGGSAAAYRNWPEALSPAVEIIAVEIPGRGRLLREPPYTSADDLVEWLLLELGEKLKDGPFAIFGHSMGGLLAFQLTHELARCGLPSPRCLILSAVRSPRRSPQVRLHDLSDSELIEVLGGLSGASAEALAHESLMELMLPVVRADLQLAETWSFVPPRPLEVPVMLVSGLGDPLVPSDEIASWSPYFSAAIHWRSYPGDHFYLLHESGALLRDLRDVLAELP